MRFGLGLLVLSLVGSALVGCGGGSGSSPVCAAGLDFNDMAKDLTATSGVTQPRMLVVNIDSQGVPATVLLTTVPLYTEQTSASGSFGQTSSSSSATMPGYTRGCTTATMSGTTYTIKSNTPTSLELEHIQANEDPKTKESVTGTENVRLLKESSTTYRMIITGSASNRGVSAAGKVELLIHWGQNLPDTEIVSATYLKAVRDNITGLDSDTKHQIDQILDTQTTSTGMVSVPVKLLKTISGVAKPGSNSSIFSLGLTSNLL